MNIEDTKFQVYRLIKTGMSRYEAELLCGVSADEQEALERDADYMARCALQPLIAERDLLELLDRIIENDAEESEAKNIRWKLERLNKARWGRAVNVSLPDNTQERTVTDLSALDEKEREALLNAVSGVLNGEEEA